MLEAHRAELEKCRPYPLKIKSLDKLFIVAPIILTAFFTYCATITVSTSAVIFGLGAFFMACLGGIISYEIRKELKNGKSYDLQALLAKHARRFDHGYYQLCIEAKEAGLVMFISARGVIENDSSITERTYKKFTPEQEVEALAYKQELAEQVDRLNSELLEKWTHQQIESQKLQLQLQEMHQRVIEA